MIPLPADHSLLAPAAFRRSPAAVREEVVRSGRKGVRGALCGCRRRGGQQECHAGDRQRFADAGPLVGVVRSGKSSWNVQDHEPGKDHSTGQERRPPLGLLDHQTQAAGDRADGDQDHANQAGPEAPARNPVPPRSSFVPNDKASRNGPTEQLGDPGDAGGHETQDGRAGGNRAKMDLYSAAERADNDRMNFRNRYLVTTLRVLLGLVMLFSGISGLIAGNSMQGVPEQLVPTMQVFWNSGIFHMIKVTETIAGLMLVIGFLPWLATLFLAPDVVGIVIFNARMFPAALPIGIAVFALTAYLGYAYWDKYRALFTRD